MSIQTDPATLVVIAGNAHGAATDLVPTPYKSDGNLDVTGAMYWTKDLMERWKPDTRWVPAYPKEVMNTRRDLYNETDVNSAVNNFGLIQRYLPNPVYNPDLPVSEANMRFIPDNVNKFYKDTITYKVIRRQPSHVGRGGPLGPKREAKPRLRETIKGEGLERYEIYGQRFLNVVQFDTWTATNDEADALIDWLEVFLLLIAGPIKKAGVSDLRYFRRIEDEVLSRWRTPLHVRSLLYEITTERLIAVREDAIREIQVSLERVHGDMVTPI